MKERVRSSITNESIERQRKGRTAGIAGLSANVVLFVLKLIAGLVSGSIAVLADAINNLSDAAVSAVTFAGFSISAKPADKEHPFGHARMEYLTGFLVAVIIIFLGFELGKSSVEKILVPDEIRSSGLMIAVLVASIVLKVGMWFYYRRTATAISSLTLKAAAADSRNDVIATSAILVSAAVREFTGFDPDGLIGLAISAMIVYFGIRLVIEAASPLLGSAAPNGTTELLEKAILSYEGILGIHDLQVHSYGYHRYFASVHCELPADRDLIESHELADRIERDILRTMDISLVIHVDPVDSADTRTIEAFERVKAVLFEISPEISVHDFRVVWGRIHTKIIFDTVLPYDFKLSIKEIDTGIKRELSRIYPGCDPIITYDRK